LLADALQALAAWPVSTYLRESTIAYATLNAAHILAGHRPRHWVEPGARERT
jgi:hypothetical protein